MGHSLKNGNQTKSAQKLSDINDGSESRVFYEPPRDLIITPSGMRGISGKSLNMEVIQRFSKSFGLWLGKGSTVVVGRDTRSSGTSISMNVISSLISIGINVIDVGVCPTPIIIYYKKTHDIDGAAIISGSHNPPQYNGIKFLSRTHTFLGKEELNEINKYFIYTENLKEAPWDELGSYVKKNVNEEYIENLLKVIELKTPKTTISETNTTTINESEEKEVTSLKVVVDPDAGAGSGVTSNILSRIGFSVEEINRDFVDYPNYPRPIEPIKPHLHGISNKIKEIGADIGFAHDCDADRVAIIGPDGEIYPEDTTVALIIEYLLNKNKQNGEPFGKPLLVTNSASSLVFELIAEKYGGEVKRTPIGERYLAIEMNKLQKEHPDKYVFGGEGSSGGFMYPQFNNARDGIFAAALVCEIIKNTGKNLNELLSELPKLYSVREKVKIDGFDIDTVMSELKKQKFDYFSSTPVMYMGKRMGNNIRSPNVIIEYFDRDIKITDYSAKEWVLVHPSNTEPIVRIITEAVSLNRAKELLDIMSKEIRSIISKIS